MKRERRRVRQSSVVAPHQSSSIVTMDFRPQEAWKPKSYAPPSEDGDSEPVNISSGKSTPEPSPLPPTSSVAAGVGVKRKRPHHGTSPGSGGGGGHVKKQKRSSVESRTVSVTRVSVPVYDDSSAEEMDTSRDSSVCESSAGPHGLSSIREEESVARERRPRSLRVSLSIPDEVEPGTPFDKVMKVHHHQRVSSSHHRDLSSVETKELPSWENFENSNLLHRASSPKQRPKTLTTEKSDILFTKSSTTVKPTPEPAVAAPSKNTHSAAFLASPLPISSSPKLSHPPTAAATPSSAPGADVKTDVGCSSFSSLDVGVKNKGSISPPVPAAVGVGYAAPAAADVVVTTRPSAPVVAAQPEVNPSSLPPQRSPHPPNQPQPQPINLSKPPSSSATSSTPATPPPGITVPSTISPTTKPIAVPTEAAAPNPSPTSGGVPLPVPLPVPVPVPVPGQQRPQQQSVLVSGPHPQPVPTATTVPPPKSTGHVLVVAQQKPPIRQQQQLPSTAAPQAVKTPPAQQIPSGPPVNAAHHQRVAISVAQSPSAAGQQVVVTSRPSIQQPVMVSNSQTSAPAMQQQVLSRPPNIVSAANQSALHQQQQRHQQQVYVASTRPASVPGHQHQQVIATTAARPSSVPIQQQRPPSVPIQQQQQNSNIVVTPRRPSSVPTQPQQVVRSHSHSHTQSQSPPVSTPTQHVLVTYSQSGAPLKQVVVTQPPAYVGKGQSPTIFQAASTCTPAPTSVFTHASPVAIQYSGSPVVQTQRQLQEQAVAAAKKHAVHSSGDADVIITAVESNASRVNQGQPNVGYHTAAVTPSGDKIVILNTSSGEAAIPYQTTAVSTGMGPGTVRNVMAKAVVSLSSVHDFLCGNNKNVLNGCKVQDWSRLGPCT